ncbi:MAG: hypothetical protein DRJ45_07270 [Thermoprotei archaeon]|nr:MAG: hypothetical protein DRJ45_07270 [Thermoprotei archaeon]
MEKKNENWKRYRCVSRAHPHFPNRECPYACEIISKREPHTCLEMPVWEKWEEIQNEGEEWKRKER